MRENQVEKRIEFRFRRREVREPEAWTAGGSKPERCNSVMVTVGATTGRVSYQVGWLNN